MQIIVLLIALVPAIMVYAAYKGEKSLLNILFAVLVLGLWEVFTLSFLFI